MNYRITNPEISELAEALGVEFPGLYRKILVMEGVGQIAPMVEVFHPSRMIENFPNFFSSGPPRFFPFGQDSGSNTIWVMDERNNVLRICGKECSPASCLASGEWLSPQEWLIAYCDD